VSPPRQKGVTPRHEGVTTAPRRCYKPQVRGRAAEGTAPKGDLKGPVAKEPPAGVPVGQGRAVGDSKGPVGPGWPAGSWGERSNGERADSRWCPPPDSPALTAGSAVPRVRRAARARAR
jgi:hypothetical protein